MVIFIYRYNDYAAKLAAYLYLGQKLSVDLNHEKLLPMKLYPLGIDEGHQQVYLLKYHVGRELLNYLTESVSTGFTFSVEIKDLRKFDTLMMQCITRFFPGKMRKILEEKHNEGAL